MRIGLVLGAGGSVGVAYHGAVLAALEDVTGWDPRQAEIIVGTSAGSITASMLRAGVAATDLVRISEGLPLSEEGTRLAEVGRPHRPRPKARDALQWRPMADPVGVVHGVLNLRTRPIGGLLAACMPAGGISTDAISRGIDAVFDGKWPDEALWLCAVALRDGKRVAFGHGRAPDATVGKAVAASSAVPGYFRPVSIGGRRYVDGGVRSMTNLDLVAGASLDLVIVSSPLSQASARPALAADTLMRQTLRAGLRAEVAALRRTGVPVVPIEPDRRIAQTMGLNPMDARPRGAVSRVTRVQVARWLAEHVQGRWLVAMLSLANASSRARRASSASAGTGGLVAADGGLLPSA
jgi:NTE family protein